MRQKQTREVVATRANHCCEYCQCMAEYIPVPFVLEHIIPIAKGGSNALENLAFACHHCNGKKYTKISAHDPSSNQTVPLFHPRKDNWQAHFRWNEDCTKMIGITPIGRATIQELDLNRERVINHRHILFLFGEYPPEHTAPSLKN